MPHIGTHATRNTSAVRTCYRLIYDHHGNVVHEWPTSILFLILFFLCFIVLYYQFVFALLHPPLGYQLSPGLAKITSACQIWLEINNIFKDALNTEIDNHVDTHYFGNNFRPLSWYDLMCSVSPFLSEYTTTDNVEICTAATAWTSHTGQV